MSLYIGQHKAKAVHIGEDMIKRVYLGNAIVYEYDMEITTVLIGCTAALPSKIMYGEALTAALVPDTGYQQLPWNTKVTMGGEDITSTAYDAATNSINITEVTGDISIEAEAVEMSSDYEPLEYVYKYAEGKYFDLGYAATNKTGIFLDFLIRSQKLTMMISRVGHTPTGADLTPDFYWTSMSSSGNLYGKVRWGNLTLTGTTYVKTPPLGQRFVASLNKGVLRYKNDTTDWSLDLTGGTFNDGATVAKKLRLFGYTTQTYASLIGDIYRVWHTEDDVIEDDYVPVRVISTGYLGLFNVKKGTLLGSYAPDYYMAPNILVSTAYTNCAATRLSGVATGSAARAVIGSTWSIKITPSSGYTFTGGTTPQVEIDGVDVTSTTVTDNGDGTYTVTIVDVPDKPIEITAACVADPNAVQSNSLLTGTPTDTPDEPMGDNSDEEEM